MQKRITIIGATAGVGLLCVQQALDKGHQLVTLSRSTDTLPKHANLIALQGSATRKDDVIKAIQHAEAVIVAIGTGKSMKATTLYTDAAQAIIAAQQETQMTAPFIILTGFGAGDSPQYQNLFVRIVMKLMLNAVYKNKTQMEQMIAASTIKWEFVRPGLLTDSPLTGKYRAVTEYNKNMKIDKISRADVAHYLISQAENPTELGKYPALSY